MKPYGSPLYNPLYNFPSWNLDYSYYRVLYTASGDMGFLVGL